MLALALSSSACNPFRRNKTSPPTPPPPAVEQSAPTPGAQQAPGTQEPERAPAEQTPVVSPAREEPPDTRTVRLPDPTPKPAGSAKPPRTPAPAAPPPAPEPAPGPAPQLGQLLSPEEQQHYARITDQALARATGTLKQLETKSLTVEQRTRLDRTLAFVRQAQDLRSRDLIQAASLAQRADVLARDLAASVR